MRVIQRVLRITIKQWKSKHRKEIAVDKQCRLVKYPGAPFNGVTGAIYAYKILDFGEKAFKARAGHIASGRKLVHLPIGAFVVNYYTIDIGGFYIEPVIADL